MLSCIFAVLAFLIPASVDAREPAAPAVLYSLQGRVLDPLGAALAGARISLLRSRNVVGSATTDEQGRFRLEGLAAGSYELTVDAAGMQPASQAVHLPRAAGAPLEIRLRLSPLATSVTVTARRGEVEDAATLPTQVNVVGSESLERRAAVFLPQALREEVGVATQQTSGHQGAVMVRGLTGQQLLHLIDGVRFNTSTFRARVQYLALVDLGFAERVEVARGPASAEYGSDSLGGAVNVLPVRPLPEAVRGRLSGEFAPFFRSADLAGGGRLKLAYGRERWSVTGGVSGARVQDLRAGGGRDSHAAVTRFFGLPSSLLGERLQDTSYSQWAGFARLHWEPAGGHTLTASYLRGEQDDGRRYDQLNGGNGQLISGFDPQRLDFFYVRYEKRPVGWVDALTGTLSFNSQRDDRTEQVGPGNLLAPVTDEFNETNVFGYQVQVATHIGANQSAVFGGELYDEYINSTAVRFEPATSATSAVRGRFPDGSRYSTVGLFYLHAVEGLAGRLRVQGGLRYSAVNLRTFADRNLTGPGGEPLVLDVNTTEHDVTFNLAAAVRLGERWRLNGAVRRGFRAPNLTNFSAIGLTPSGFEVSPEEGARLDGTLGSTADDSAVPTGRPVRALVPEVLWNYEGGLRFAARRMTASVAGFVNDVADFITRRTLLLPPGAMGGTVGGQLIIDQLASGAVITAADPRPVQVRANEGSVRIWGVEAASEAELSSEWFARAHFTYLRARDNQTGGPPDIEGGMPPATGFVSLRWQPAGKRYWLEGYTHLVGKQDRLSPQELADQRIGALRSAASIARFFQNGAVARGLVSGGVLLATGETLAEVIARVLGPGGAEAPLFRKTPGFATLNLRGGFPVGEQSDVIVVLENLLDKNYRWHGSGVDAAGFNLQVSWRYRF